MRPRPARKAFARGRRLAKRSPDVQQSGGFFPPLGTAGRGEKSLGGGTDVAFAVLFLVSEFASYITGQVLVVDGGMVL